MWNPFKKSSTEQRTQSTNLGNLSTYLPFNSRKWYTPEAALTLSAVYRCVQVISDSVAQLPLEPYKVDSKGGKRKFKQHPSYWILNREPNKRMSRFDFMKALVTSVLLKGNGYAYIKRDNSGNVEGLYFLNAENVSFVTGIDPVSATNPFQKIKYVHPFIDHEIEEVDMIHIKNFTYNGIWGVSTLHHAFRTLELAINSESHASGFFKSGGLPSGVLRSEGNLTDEQITDLRETWRQTFSPDFGEPNGVAVLSGEFTYTPITVNPADAQLLQTRQFNVIEICRFFGVSPTKCFDFTHSSYATVEATQNAFLTDTLAPLLEKIELEFERKLYKPSERDSIDVKFDVNALLRVDVNSMVNRHAKYYSIGVMSPNDIRADLDLPPIENGDNYFTQVNTQTLDQAVDNAPDEIITYTNTTQE